MRGGRRLGAGRPKGAATKRTREIADRAAAEGMLPLDYMLDVMRDPAAEPSRRDDMAKAAAAYLHPRLSSVDAHVDGQVSLDLLVEESMKRSPGDED